MNKIKIILLKILPIFFWLILWWLLSITINQPLLLVSPIIVFNKIINIILSNSFITIIISSISKITIGLFSATLTGIIFAYISNKNKYIKPLISSLILTIKSIPVASIIILILIWVSSANISIIISYMMVLPIIYQNILIAFDNLDNKLIEMANIFNINKYIKYRYIYISQLLPYFTSATITSIGFSFKAGIAAEIIGLPTNSIGTSLYESKIFFDIPSLFAWTIIIIILSYLYETFFKLLIKIIAIKLKKINISKYPSNNINSISKTLDKDIIINNLTKIYDNKIVLNISKLIIKANKTTTIVGKSGNGKTTLINILMKLTNYDKGQILNLPSSYSTLFQEDRLVNNLDIYTNILLPHINKESYKYITKPLIDTCLSKLDLIDSKDKLIIELSGGMKRRVALIRAILANYQILFLDEPFKGLDIETKNMTINFINEYAKDKTIILITHDILDAKLLNSTNIYNI